ncbi:hypothetical protein WJ969_06190 [Achromobacter xylosoxidans]
MAISTGSTAGASRRSPAGARGLFPGGSRIAGRTREGLRDPASLAAGRAGFFLSRLFGSLLQQQFSDCGELF